MKRNRMFFLLVLMPFLGFAQEGIKEKEKANELDDVVITASRKKESIKEVVSSITIVGEKKIQSQTLVN
jgi:iron complex outermembrane receptor protein